MPNINLKYLIIGVLSLSILIIMGAFIFSLMKPNRSPSNQKTDQAATKQINKDNKQLGGGGGSGTSEGAKPSSKPKPSK